MAFFDDLGKKLSQAGQTAVQKTKEMTDIARINGMISDEEKKVNNNYYQIGKLYVAMHQTDFESDFAEMMTAIKESETKIRDYKQQIQDIKGVVRCEKCGAEVVSNVAFCSSCGAPMPKQDTSANNGNLIKCTGCDAMVDKNMRFCTSCGKPTADIVKDANDIPSVINESTAEPVTNRCPNCGVAITEGLAFCTECGTKLN